MVALLSVSLSVKAQPYANTGYAPDGVVLSKTVIEGEKPNTYTINLETFVTGETIVTEAGGPLDVVLVLDFSGSLEGQKWANLESAVSNFLKSLRDYETQYSAGVKIGIVSFNSNYATHTIGLVDPTSEDITRFISRLDNHEFEPQGSTRIDFGMRQANDWLYGYGRRDVMKSVVVFTDGQPESANTSQFENLKVAMDAINYAQTMKMSYGATIYSIGLISEGDEDELIRSGSDSFGGYVGQATNISGEYLTTKSFLERLSSKYPEASIASVSSGVLGGYYFDKDRVNFGDGWMSPKNEEDTYYQRAETNTLSDIFSEISEKIIGGASYELEETSTTVIDVVSPAFKLPDGADGSKIKLYAAKCHTINAAGTDGSATYTWETPIEIPNELFPNVRAAVGVLAKTTVEDRTIVEFTEQEGGKAVSVTGFDFSNNFVGYRNTPSGQEIGGYKLIISFPIEIDPSNPGGATQNTNTEDSGIYVDHGEGYEQIGSYEIPTVKIPNIVVIKNGLKKGDSAIFNVYKIEEDGTKSQFPIVLVATCKEDGKPAYAKSKIQKTGRYTIEESSWSWAYNISNCVSSYTKDDSSSITTEQWHEKGFGAEGETGYVARIPWKFGTETTANSITRNVNDFTEEENLTEGYKGTLFIFNNTAKTGTPAHAEANNNNVFYECD